MIGNSRFNSFVQSELNNVDYMFIDPPSNYRPSQYGTADFWQDITFAEMFSSLNADTLFIWTTIDNIPALVAGHIESAFELKAFVPYIRAAKHEDLMIGLKTGFKNPLQYLAVFQRKGAALHTLLYKHIIVEHDNEWQRPVLWENNCFLELLEDGFKGLYILPNGGIADTDISGCDCSTSHITKKELF